MKRDLGEPRDRDHRETKGWGDFPCPLRCRFDRATTITLRPLHVGNVAQTTGRLSELGSCEPADRRCRYRSRDRLPCARPPNRVTRGIVPGKRLFGGDAVQRSKYLWTRRTRVFTLATVMVLVFGVFGLTTASAASVSPVTGGAGAIVPPSLNLTDLSHVGYQKAEYFLSGTASAYSPNAPLASDGNWSVSINPAPEGTAGYTTRFVVFRPSDPAKFNGTVVVEWLNVSGGVDGNPDWTMTHNELIREGAAYVGVSAQAVGVNQLKCPATLPSPPVPPCLVAPGDPVRYASLLHPGDSFSYDIFSQAGQAIRDNSAALLGATPTT